MKSSNPMINSRVYENVILDSQPMSIQGTINKTILMVFIVVASACYTWNLCLNGFADKAWLLTAVGFIAGLILAIITSFKPNNAKITCPIYAICEGLLVGTVSFMYNSFQDGIVVNAVAITLITLFSMLLLYKTGIVRATDTFRRVIIISTFAIAIFYFVGIIGALLGHPMTIFNGSAIGIGLSLVICVIAALNFILDFDFIERGVNSNLPEYFEWYGAFTLLVTLIWLYLEIIKLLAQSSRRN